MQFLPTKRILVWLLPEASAPPSLVEAVRADLAAAPAGGLIARSALWIAIEGYPDRRGERTCAWIRVGVIRSG